MKARAIAIIDYEFSDGFIEAAEEQKKLEAAIEQLVKATNSVVYHEVDMRERRNSDRTPNLKKMKIRLS